MPIDTELEEAGRRLAHQPIDLPPPVGELHHEVQRRRTNSRLLGGVAVGTLMLVGVATTTLASRDDVQLVAAAPAADGTDDGAGLVVPTEEPDTDSSLDSDSGSSSASNSDSDSDSGSDADGGSGDRPDHDDKLDTEASYGFRFDDDSGDASASWGTWWTEVSYAVGDEATAAAAEAESSADETRLVDGTTVWITRTVGDDGTDAVLVSSLNDDTFTRVSGPATLEDELIEAVTHSKRSFGDWAKEADEWEEDWKELTEDWEKNWAEQAEEWEEDWKELTEDWEQHRDDRAKEAEKWEEEWEKDWAEQAEKWSDEWEDWAERWSEKWDHKSDSDDGYEGWPWSD
jgi:hypothetical protein